MAEPTLTFDASRKRMTIEFHEPPALDTLEVIAARLRQNDVRCVHAVVGLEWSDPDAPDWDDPRQVSIEKALPPSLASFIFDASYETVARQSYYTVGDFCDILEACPQLSRAFLTGCSQMRKTRHEHLRELYLLGRPLDESIIPALASSQFPALESIVFDGIFGVEFYEYHGPSPSQSPVLAEQFAYAKSRMEELAAGLRAMKAPRLSTVYLDGVAVLTFLAIVGREGLPCNLCLRDIGFDNVDGLFDVLQRHDALRSGKLRLDSPKFFASEIAQLKEMGVTVEDTDHLFSPAAYSDW